MYQFTFYFQQQQLLLQPLLQPLLQQSLQQPQPQPLPPQPPQANRIMRIRIIQIQQLPFPQNILFVPFSAPD
jgi:hypothetical protein